MEEEPFLLHPFERIPERHRRNTFVALFLATVGILMLLQGVDEPLRTKEAPWGIVSFELARSPAHAQRIIDSWWSHSQAVFAGLSLGLDFLFIPLYSCTIGLACVLVGLRHEGRAVWLTLGRLMAYSQWVAGLLDAFEDAALIGILKQATPTQSLTSAAFWAAAIKFGLIAVGLVYALLGRLVPEKRRKESLR